MARQTKDIQVVFGGQTWQVMALSNSREGVPGTEDADKTPNIVLTLWLADVLKDNTNAYVEKYFNPTVNIYTSPYSADKKYPDSMYGSSYIRAFVTNGTMNNGAYLLNTGADTLDGIYTADPNYPLKEFLAGGQYNKCLLTPSSLKWQETETATKALTVLNNILPNDAYGTPRSGNSGWYADYGMSNYVKTSNQDVYQSWQNDYLWLPSVTETGWRNDLVGMWSTSQGQRASMSGANDQFVWLL